MSFLRPILSRTVPMLILGLTVAACGGSGATTAPGVASGPPTATAPAATAPADTAALPTATVALTVAPSVAAAGGLPDCSGSQIGRKAFTTEGFQAQHFCGPAKATVTAAGATAQIASGWCETNSAGFTVSIGTQLFGSPSASQEPDVLIILVDPTSGAGSISGVVNHRHYLLTGSPVQFGAGKLSGTFSGPALVGGTVSGSFTCS